jgi:hypothetical protein
MPTLGGRSSLRTRRRWRVAASRRRSPAHTVPKPAGGIRQIRFSIATWTRRRWRSARCAGSAATRPGRAGSRRHVLAGAVNPVASAPCGGRGDPMPCRICKTWWGQPSAPGQCEQVACLACGAVQCMGNGSCRGTCAICYFGMLPGWSGNDQGRPCAYKGCANKIVSRYAPRKGRVCLEHLNRILGTAYQVDVQPAEGR